MPRDTYRRRNRSRSRSRRRSPPRDELEEKQRRIRDLEAELERKNRRVAEKEKRLYGVEVEIYAGNYSNSENGYYMSPIRIGVPDDSPPRRNRSPSRRFDVNNQSNFDMQYPTNEYPIESPGEEQYRYEYPPEFQVNGYQPSHFYHDNQEVRVEEMPRWPMQGSPENSYDSEPVRSFSPTPKWRHQQEVQIDPMPVFPVDGEEEEEAREPSPIAREDKARIQMMMIAQQAEQAENQPRSYRRQRRDSPEQRRPGNKEREERRKARHEIGKIRQQVIQKMENEKKEKELKQREKERKLRHAQLRKQEEDEAAKRREARRKEEELSRQSESDEFFLQYLIPAIGKLETKSSKIEGKSPIEYVTVCNAVNIPKELLYGSKIEESKGESYKGAISNYVEKLVNLGVIDSKTRRLLKRIEKLPKFLAELVEPLCNDIAIYGTQISVTDERDMRSKFDAFVKEKSAEFWKSASNTKKLTDLLKRYDRKRNPSRSRSRSRDRKRDNRRRSSSRDRPPKIPSPDNEESLKMLFASASDTANQQLPSNFNQFPNLNGQSSSNFMPQSSLPSLLSLPLQPPPSSMMGSYMQQPSQVCYNPNPQYDVQMMNGYGQYQQPMMQQPQQNLYQAPHQQGYQTSREDDAALMDEIFT